MISIIMPVYNPGEYLRPCIESVLAQTYSDWELLLVDDGSTDGADAICDEYVKKDKRIRTFHKKNEGATSARKFGVEHAQGEWVLFSDSDDELPPNSLEKLVSLDNHNTDIIVGTVWYKNSNILYKTTTAEGCISPNEYICCLLDHTTQIGPVAKLIKRSLFCNLEWIDRKVTNNEDLYMLICVALNSRKQVVISNDDGFYICNDRSGTISSRVMGYDAWKLLFISIYQQLLRNSLMQGNTGVAYFNYVTRTLRRMCVERNVNYKDDDFIKLLKGLQNTFSISSTRNLLIVTNHKFRSFYIFINSIRKHI